MVCVNMCLQCLALLAHHSTAFFLHHVLQLWVLWPVDYLNSVLLLDQCCTVFHFFSFPIVLLFRQCFCPSLSGLMFISDALSMRPLLWCFISISSVISQNAFPWFSHNTLLTTFKPLINWMYCSHKHNLFWWHKRTLRNAFNHQEYVNESYYVQTRWGKFNIKCWRNSKLTFKNIK